MWLTFDAESFEFRCVVLVAAVTSNTDRIHERNVSQHGRLFLPFKGLGQTRAQAVPTLTRILQANLYAGGDEEARKNG